MWALQCRTNFDFEVLEEPHTLQEAQPSSSSPRCQVHLVQTLQNKQSGEVIFKLWELGLRFLYILTWKTGAGKQRSGFSSMSQPDFGVRFINRLLFHLYKNLGANVDLPSSSAKGPPRLGVWYWGHVGLVVLAVLMEADFLSKEPPTELVDPRLKV